MERQRDDVVLPTKPAEFRKAAGCTAACGTATSPLHHPLKAPHQPSVSTPSVQHTSTLRYPSKTFPAHPSLLAYFRNYGAPERQRSAAVSQSGTSSGRPCWQQAAL
ncbi:hypothetical protein EYF80_043707 [Liparis tanakae]|uniref:Uncharacterized protein n=1 Tax=Liparis tanakae TaxID=230148 RepID=A0A4Z2FXY5_9TELE|nr:hypothetical protein EYF80_043707 [Liparis tanakae]